MCGLIAIISKSTFGFLKKDVDMFTQLLYADRLRGQDGTGVFYNGKKGASNVHTLRAPMPSSDFIATQEYANVMKQVFKESNFIVGHNRAATKGKINAACTHPFREKHITLVHNGTLETHIELSKDKEVDSQAICEHLSVHGAEETLKKINGAFALIWFNSKEGTLNFCRNIQRPLFIIETRNSFVLCSELELGQWICARNSEFIVSHKSIIPETLYSINIKDTSKLLERKVKYKSFFPAPSYPIPITYKDPYKDSKEEEKVTYLVGDWVKVKASIITTQHTTYLSAHILKDKNTPIAQRDPSKYEYNSRVRIYGEIEYLRELCKKVNLVGKVGQVCWRFGESHLVLEDVKEEVCTIHETKESSKVGCCDFCDTPFTGKTNKRYLIDDYVLCKTCADDMYTATQASNQEMYC
ncbi:hypothetical protein [Caudoviricetes sp.]|nr:hypothetical protein [Caudoviricetes sp.]